MPVQSVTPILNVSSIGESFCWFELFGWQRGFSWNQGGPIEDNAASNEHGPAGFGSVCSGQSQIFLCVDGQGSRGTKMPSYPGDDRTDGVWMTWWVQSPAEVDQLFETARKHQAVVTMPPTDEPWGVREFHLRHPDGHMFRVSSGLTDRD